MKGILSSLASIRLRRSSKVDQTTCFASVFAAASAIFLACSERSNASLLVAMSAALVFWGHLRWQLGRFDPDDSVRLMMLFRSNRDSGLLVVLFFAVAAML